jgi:hypothetical protein
VELAADGHRDEEEGVQGRDSGLERTPGRAASYREQATRLEVWGACRAAQVARAHARCHGTQGQIEGRQNTMKTRHGKRGKTQRAHQEDARMDGEAGRGPDRSDFTGKRWGFGGQILCKRGLPA